MSPKHKKPATTAAKSYSGQSQGLRRTTRHGGKSIKKPSTYEDSSDSDLSEVGESASDGDVEDEDVEEPESYAPSRSARQKRGHQTGLSDSLSKTNINKALGRKRALSSSSEETIKGRPRKLSKPDTPDLSENSFVDDDDYDGVNDISESEVDGDSERKVQYQDTQDIIESEEENDFANFVLDNEMHDSAFDEQYARTDFMSDFYSSEALNDGATSAPADETPTRRVRFAGIDSSTSSETSSDFDNTFPDLLGQEVDYNSFPQTDFPTEDDDDEQSSDGYWELEGNNPYSEEDRILAEEGFDENSGASGYETDSDDGTTTEEDEAPPITNVNTPKKMLEIKADSPLPHGTRPRLTVPRHRPVNSKMRKGPVLGTWIADPTKPIAVIKSGVVKYYHIPSKSFGPASSHVSSAESSPQRSFVPLARPSSAGYMSQGGQSPSNAVSQMSSPGAGADILSSDVFLPLEFDADALFTDYDDEEDEIENSLNIDDLIDFGDDSDSDQDDAGDSSAPQTPAKSLQSQKLPKITPKQSADRPSSRNLLEHFDRGIVSAFRRNQHRAQTVTHRLPIGSLVAIKGGRHTVANNPISPLRRRKNRTLSQTSSAVNNGGVVKRRPVTPTSLRSRQNTL